MGYTKGRINRVEGNQLDVNYHWYHIELDYIKKCEPPSELHNYATRSNC